MRKVGRVSPLKALSVPRKRVSPPGRAQARAFSVATIVAQAFVETLSRSSLPCVPHCLVLGILEGSGHIGRTQLNTERIPVEEEGESSAGVLSSDLSEQVGECLIDLWHRNWNPVDFGVVSSL